MTGQPTAFLFCAVFVDTVVGHNELTVREPRAKRCREVLYRMQRAHLSCLSVALQAPLPEGFQHSDYSKEDWGLEIEFRCGSALC